MSFFRRPSGSSVVSVRDLRHESLRSIIMMGAGGLAHLCHADAEDTNLSPFIQLAR